MAPFSRLAAEGTIFLRLHSLPTGHGSAFTGRGTFRLTILPAAPPPGSIRTGLEGVAMVGPIFPVDRPGVPNSRPLPGALITVQPAGGGKEIAPVRADDHGQFQFRLVPWTYLLAPLPPEPGQFLPRGIPEAVTVPVDEFAQVVANYDSGIR
jgi:hypothetical protein